MLSLTKILHGAFRQISTIVSYNAVWKAKAKYHPFHELNRRGCVTLANWLCFNPLCEFVNCHQEVGLLILGPFKGPTMSSPQTANGQVIGIIRSS